MGDLTNYLLFIKYLSQKGTIFKERLFFLLLSIKNFINCSLSFNCNDGNDIYLYISIFYIRN